MTATTSLTFTHTVDSLDDYLRTVHLTRDEWNVPDHRELWFRAEDESHLDTCLQPGLYRPRKGTPRKDCMALLELENDLYEEFSRCAPQLSDLRLQDEEWDSYFLMQHHGAPTRLLDWTDGALIALHFAVRNKTAPFGSGAIIHILDVGWLVQLLKRDPDRKDAHRRWKSYNKKHPHDTYEDDWDRLYLPMDEEDAMDPLLATPVTPLLWDSPHVSRRVAAQRSRFMLFGTDPLWIYNLATKNDSHLHSIKVPSSAIAEIKKGLIDAGISESVVFPDLDGLGRELKQQWDARR
jgi:hypothetical protein